MDTATLDATVAETGSPADTGIGDFTLPENAATSIAPELLATAPQPNPTAEDADSEPLDSEEAEPEAPDEQAQLASWVESLIDNPRSITSIPRAQQPAAMEAWASKTVEVAQQAIQMAYAAGMQAAEQRSATTRQIAEIDAALEDGDIDQYRALVSKFQGGERGYHAAKAQLSPIPEASPEAFQQRVNAIWQDLTDRPDVQEALRSQWNYPASADGVARLEADIRKLLKRPAKGPDPDQKVLQQRAENTQRLRNTPKPDTTPGSGSAGIPSRKEAEALTDRDWARLYDNAKRSPEGRAELERWEKAASGR